MDSQSKRPPQSLHGTRRSKLQSNGFRLLLASISLSSAIFFTVYSTNGSSLLNATDAPLRSWQLEAIAQCQAIQTPPGPAPDFHEREQSDRFVEGTNPVLIKNARVWTGAKNGTEILRGTDILLHNGIIQRVGHLGAGVEASLAQEYRDKLVTIDAKGAWVTPGIVDVHSHAGVDSAPELPSAIDGNSVKGDILPWLRSVDGINTHDDAYQLGIAGGVTTALVLPGSADAIGGQAFVIKLRHTAERSTSSMLLEPPSTLNSSSTDPNVHRRWRHIKHACGENPSNTYQQTRMDTVWDFRQAYNTAKQLKEKQDKYCARALSKDWQGLGDFPQDLKWEALVDVLRGRVKVNTHCYEAVDIDDFVRLTQEFKFPVAAFHHASEAYLVPERLKQAYGGPPAIALFASFARYKREAYRSSEFAPRILAENGITVLMKADDPAAINLRYLLHEAQLAFFHGFPANLALASVTSNAAETLGMGHRVGYVREGYDADLVIWDSHPLALGAAPKQVFIDGIQQLEQPFVVEKPENFQKTPRVPNWDKEARETVEWEGLPPLLPPKKKGSLREEVVIFENVKSVHVIKSGAVVNLAPTAVKATSSGLLMAVAVNGSIACYGDDCASFASGHAGEAVKATYVDLEGGEIVPGLVSYGCSLGMDHIMMAPSTVDGSVYNPLEEDAPKILGEGPVIRAVDGLQYQTRNSLLAYRNGVTTGITSPLTAPMQSLGFLSGLGTAFSLSAAHKLEKGAVVQAVTAVHISLSRRSATSVSTQIATLRRLLLGEGKGELVEWFKKVREGELPLVVLVYSADIIATLITLKKQVEAETGVLLRLTITGASEAYLLAQELAEANVSVILSPIRPFPLSWEQRRILPGPPLSKNSAVVELLEHNVTVGVGCESAQWGSAARNLPFDIAWAAIESGGRISKEQAIAMGTTNILESLGVNVDSMAGDLVATRGGDLLDMESKVAAVLSPRQDKVHVFV
ncbi:hypothetical protein D9619_001862 [Psilocybe cf. subviscida]|uniref:Amidohydrolase-related domain-containing protein n=1 Tax=Psilocybe cf. subviscida TaxID=2480587 RepID=A0A8H5BFA1_9AGAR|nr:hypothetical protein D9619_001862 [Psilocybe cf. subviscida]